MEAILIIGIKQNKISSTTTKITTNPKTPRIIYFEWYKEKIGIIKGL
jgi:hypothetical protein